MSIPAPEPTPTPAGTSLVGQLVSGRYRIERLLGEGGMGAVYLAEHTHMRKRVAIKLLHPEMSKDEEVLARFRREAEAAAHVEHPNVAAATDFGQTAEGAFFLVLEYVEGTSLRDVLDKGALAPDRSLHVARQIALALERAHGAGIVHRDLKPENVMLVQKEEDPDFVKVLDFGIAKVEAHPTRDTTQPLTRLGTILGTPEYMAPEQALGEVVGPGSDLYAVGVMLYEMLTGLHPFDANDRMAVLSMHIVAPVPKMSDRNPAIDVPRAVEDLTRRLLEKDVKLRPESARTLVDEIDVAAAQSGLALPHAVSRRAFGRESSPGPDLARSPVPGDAGASPSAPWQATDSLAKTDYGIPASTPQLPGSPEELDPLAALPAFLSPLKKLPRPALLAGAASIPIFVLVLIVTLILARRATPTAGDGDAAVIEKGSAVTARASRASASELRAATTQGGAALEALAATFPEDPAVHKQLAVALSEGNRTPEMLRAVRTLAKLDASAIDDALMLAVVAAAQRSDTADDAFALLEGPLGPRGFDALLDLSTNKTLPVATRARASKAVQRPDVKAHASKASAVFVDFKAANGCAGKRELLERVRESGDARLLATLKTMKSPRGCGFMGMRDCWSCMRKDDTLDDAIQAVEARSSK